jgi:hypothetical protein
MQSDFCAFLFPFLIRKCAFYILQDVLFMQKNVSQTIAETIAKFYYEN